MGEKIAAWSLRIDHPIDLPTPGGKGLILLINLSVNQLGNDLFRPVTLGIRTKPAEFRASRKPLFSLRFDGSFLLRLADRQFAASLFQLPPRFTRFEPNFRIVHREYFKVEFLNCQLFTPALFAKAVNELSRFCNSNSLINPSFSAFSNRFTLRFHRRLLR